MSEERIARLSREPSVRGLISFWVLGERQYAMRVLDRSGQGCAAISVSASDILNVPCAPPDAQVRPALSKLSLLLQRPGVAGLNQTQCAASLGRLTTLRAVGDIICEVGPPWARHPGFATKSGRRRAGSVELYGLNRLRGSLCAAPFWVSPTPGALMCVPGLSTKCGTRWGKLKKVSRPGFIYINIYDVRPTFVQPVHPKGS